jgi:Spy/CpxP family protein refolding chaperone
MSTFKTLIKTTLTSIALCLSLAIGLPAMAHRGHHQKHDDMHQIMSELSLTDTQKQDIKQILKQNCTNRGLFRIDAKSLQAELRSLVQSTQWDPTAVESAITQRQVLMQEKALLEANNKNLLWNVLTDTQQAEFVGLLDNLKAKLETRKAKGKDRSVEARKKGNKLKRLNLTEEQIAAVQAIRNEAKARGEKIKANLDSYKQAERSLIHNTGFNAEAWQTLNSQYQSDFLAIAVFKAKIKQDTWNLLTVEQQTKAERKFKSKKGKHNKRGKKHQQC